MFLALLGLSALTSIVMSAVLGVRLLRLATRTRALPELSLGLSFVSAGVIGWVLLLAGAPTEGGDSPGRPLLFLAGYFFISIGFASSYLFTWATFRRTEPVATAVASAAVLLVLATSFQTETAPGADGQVTAWRILGQLVRAGAGIWGASEAFAYHRRMLRQMRLGLASPFVANRFWLWGVASSATACISLVATRQSLGLASATDPTQVVAISLLTVVVAVHQLLVFFPPRRYESWLMARRVPAPL